MQLDILAARKHFKALETSILFFDNPGGTQMCRQALEQIRRRLVDYYETPGIDQVAGTPFEPIIQANRQAAADFLNAACPEEIIFGPNTTALVFHMARTLGQTLRPRDTIVVTRMDHDANVDPWRVVAEERGCALRWVNIDPQDGSLDLEGLKQALAAGARLVAFTCASNVTGTITPAIEIISLAHQAGALTFLDAVQYAPHAPIDVQALGADFLVTSVHKYFGPHMGMLYGRLDLLESLRPIKVQSGSDRPPHKFELGTQRHETVPGFLGVIEYLASLGAQEDTAEAEPSEKGRRANLKRALDAIYEYEQSLSRALLQTLQEVPGLRIYGIRDEARLSQRMPIFSFTLEGYDPLSVAEYLKQHNIVAWNGSFRCTETIRRFGLETQGGLVRVGAVHYNTLEEVEQIGKALHFLRH